MPKLKKFPSVVSLAIILSLNVGYSAPAMASNSEAAVCEAKLAESKARALKLWPDRLGGLGNRGLLGTLPEATAENVELAAGLGIMDWNVKVFIVGSEEEARDTNKIAAAMTDIQGDPKPLADGTIYDPDTSQAAPYDMVKATSKRMDILRAQGKTVTYNPSMTGLYVILPGVNLKDLSEDEVKALARQIPDLPILEVDEQGHISRLDPKLVKERFDPEMMERKIYFAKLEPHHFKVSGWFFPKNRGVLMVDDMFTSSTYKKVGDDARRTNRKNGLVIKVNQNLELGMRMAWERERKGQTTSNNRVSEDMIANWLKLKEQGIAFNFESWATVDGKETLMGGSYGLFKNGSLCLDSVFGQQIDYAKYVNLLLRERLRAVGMKYIDLEMVTPFTRDMKGKYITAAEFIKLLDEADPFAKPDFVTPFDVQTTAKK